MRTISSRATATQQSQHHMVPCKQAHVQAPKKPSVMVKALSEAPRSRDSHNSRSIAPIAKATTTPADAPVASTSEAVDYFATDKRPIILYDGVCGLCNRGVNRMLELDPSGVFRMAALQSTPGRQLLTRCGRSPDDLSSIVLVEEGGHYIKSEAILRIASKLNLPAPLLTALFFPVPKFMADVLYDQVANNRYSFFGRSDTCRCEAGIDAYQDRFLGA